MKTLRKYLINNFGDWKTGLVFDETYNIELLTEEMSDPKIIKHPASKNN